MNSLRPDVYLRACVCIIFARSPVYWYLIHIKDEKNTRIRPRPFLRVVRRTARTGYAKSAPRFRAARRQIILPAREWIYILAATKKRTGQKEIPTLYFIPINILLYRRWSREREVQCCKSIGPIMCECCRAGTQVSEPTAKFIMRICLDAGRSSFGEKLVGAMALKGMLNCSIKVFELLQIVKLESSSNWIHLIAKSRL